MVAVNAAKLGVLLALIGMAPAVMCEPAVANDKSTSVMTGLRAAPKGRGSNPLGAATAGVLTTALVKAKLVDPLYRAGLAEFDSNVQLANMSGSAYYPQLKLATGQTDNDAGARRNSVAVIQPLWSAVRSATRKEYEPRMVAADASLALREVDLTKRLYAALSDMLLARESLVQNRVLIDALTKEQKAAQTLLERGRGTITDVRDAEVKLLQAKGEALRLNAQLDAAMGKLNSMVGEAMVVPELNPRADGQGVQLEGPAQAPINPELVLAEQNEVLALLGADKARAAWLPEVNFTINRTEVGGQVSTYSGVALALPLEAGKFYDQYASQAKAVQAQEERRDKERFVSLELGRLKALVAAGLAEVPVRLQAVRAAELSVLANQKSFEGGVKTVMDVLNSIQTVYAVKTDYVKALLALADSLLQLRIQQGYDGNQGLADVQALLFSS